MRLVHISPKAITHKVGINTTVCNLETITSWLTQWTVPNNYKQVILDLDVPEQTDPFKEYATQFMDCYRSGIDHKAQDSVMDEFTFEISVMPIDLAKPFWPSNRYVGRFTVRQLVQGILK